MLIPYGYDPREPNGWPYAWCTVDELETKVAWRRLHPEFKRRLLAIFAATAGPDGRCRLGIGGGWRSPQQQEATFRSRYAPGYNAAAKSRVYWANAPEGAGWWSIKSNNLAPSTPPGLSWHEDAPEVDDGDPTTSHAYACDTIGDWAFLAEHCAEYGLVEFEDVNDEPWHAQPKELPNARRNYTNQTLKVWVLPNDHPIVIAPPVVVHPPIPPVTPPTPGGLELTAMYQIALDYAPGRLECRVTATEIIHEVNADAAAVDRLAGVRQVILGWEQLLAMLAGGRRTVGDPFGQPGDPWYDKTLADAWAARRG